MIKVIYAMTDTERDCGEDFNEIGKGSIIRLDRTNRCSHAKKYAQLYSPPVRNLFEEFLHKCKQVIEPANEINRGIEKIRKRFDEVDSSFKDSPLFTNFLLEIIPKTTSEPWQCMKNVADTLKEHAIKKTGNHFANPTVAASNNRINVTDERTQGRIARLELTLVKLSSKIQSLEQNEVNFEESDDENSDYMKVSRFKKRFCQVYNKICQIRKTTNDYGSSHVIRFSGTKIPSVNRAIERFYNDKKEFPDYHDILNVVLLANDRKRLGLSQSQIHETAEVAFEELGQILKLQRQYDFHDVMCAYLPDDDDDPALMDSELEQKLSLNKRQHGHKIDELINKYANQQEEDNLEPVEVGTDEESSASNSEEDYERESVTSLSEYEIESAPDEELAVRVCSIELPDVTKLPAWRRYSKNPVLHVSSSFTSEMTEPCCSKSLITSRANQKRKESPSDSDYSNPSERKKCKLIASNEVKRSSFQSYCKKTKENIPTFVDEEEMVETRKKISLALDSTSESDSYQRRSNEFVGPEELCGRSTNREKDKFDIGSAASNRSVVLSKFCNVRPSISDSVVLKDFATSKNKSESTIECYTSINEATTSHQVINDETYNIFKLGQVNCVPVDLPKPKIIENSGSCSRREAKITALPVSSIHVSHSKNNVLRVPNGVSSFIKKTEVKPTLNSDDDIVILDELPSPDKPSIAESPANEIIDVDKLENSTQVSQDSHTPTIDLGTFIQKIDFVSPNVSSALPSSRRMNNVRAQPLSINSSRLRSSMSPAKRSTPYARWNRPRPSQTIRFNANYARNPFERRAMRINHRVQQFNRTIQTFTAHSNEIRFVRSNYCKFASERMTTVQKSVFQRTPEARFPLIPNRGLASASGPNSTPQSTRGLLRRVQSSMFTNPADDVVTLD